VTHDRIVLPASVFGGLDAATIEAWEGSMYSLFETRFGVRLIRAEEHLTAVVAPRDVAGELRVAPRSPLLAVERVAYTYDDLPMEWRLGHYDTTDHFYATTLRLSGRRTAAHGRQSAPATGTPKLRSLFSMTSLPTAAKRPKHLDLLRVSLPLPAKVSILHRVSGLLFTDT
jgi:hypothetical protein